MHKKNCARLLAQSQAQAQAQPQSQAKGAIDTAELREELSKLTA